MSQYQAPDIVLEDGAPTTVYLSSLANSYCYVEQPFSEGSLISGPCAVHLPKATRAVQGNWNVFLGIPGRIEEVHHQRHVTVECEYKNILKITLAICERVQSEARTQQARRKVWRQNCVRIKFSLYVHNVSTE